MMHSDLTQQLSNYPNLKLAILFGSLANGTANEDSDLDLAVLFDQVMTPELKQQIIGDLALLFGRPVDLVDLKKAGIPLIGQIFKGKRVFGSSTEHGKLLSRYLIDAADFMPIYERSLKYRRDKWINT